MANKPDIASHAATYAGVIALIKWGAIAAAMLAALAMWCIA